MDDAAMVDRICYAITNPVNANLVESHDEWPGLALWFGNVDGPIVAERLREQEYLRAHRIAKRNGETVNREDFVERVELVLEPADGAHVDVIAALIREREAELARARRSPVLGARRVLAADPFDRPTRSKRSPMPLCHASTRAMIHEAAYGGLRDIDRIATRALRVAVYGEEMHHAPVTLTTGA